MLDSSKGSLEALAECAAAEYLSTTNEKEVDGCLHAYFDGGEFDG